MPYGAKFTKNASDPIHADNPNNGWLEHDMDWLDVVCKIYLALDADDSGKMAKQSILPRLGAEKCMQVDFPPAYKDANACHLAEVEIYPLFQHARNADPADLRRPSDFEHEIWEEFYPGSKYLFFDYGPDGSWQYREYANDPRGVCMLPDA